MPRTVVKTRCSLATAAAAGLLALLGARGAAAQCYNGDSYIYDLCATETSGTIYDTRGALHGFEVNAEGHEFLIATLKADLTIWDVTNLAPGSLTPRVASSLHIPWDGVKLGADSHWPYTDHLPNIATLANYPYALASMYDFGWDFLHVGATSQGFLGNGYKPAAQLTNGTYVSAALFEVGGIAYAAGQQLDQASIAANDKSVRIYTLGSYNNPSAPPGSATMGQGVRVPAGSAGDGAYAGFPLALGSNQLWAYYDSTSGKTFLFVRYITGGGLLIVDVSTPSQPQPVTWIQSDSTLFAGNWAVDSDNQTLWVGDPTHPIIHPYQIVVGSVLGLATVTLNAGTPFPYWGDGTASAYGTVISARGGLLVAASGYKIGYLSLLGGGTPTPMAKQTPYTDLSGRICANSAYNESVNGITAFRIAGNYFACRSMIVSADIVGINNACMSTTPVPGFSISGGDAAAACNLTAAENGFPGDTLTITDQSGGVWSTGGSLDIQSPPGSTIGTSYGGSFPATITQHGSVQWPSSPSTPPGDFTVVETISGGTPNQASKTLTLCAAPKATLTVNVGGTACVNPATGCNGLVNDGVVLGNTAQGHPAVAVGPTYFYQAASDPSASQGSSFSLAAKTTYTVGVVVPYSFTAPNDPNCSNALFGANVPATPYHACSVGTIVAGYGAASFEVQQPAGAKVADALQAGNVLVDQPVTLKFTGRVATGDTPNFTWTGIGMAGQPACVYSGAPSYTGTLCTIPAGALTVGPAQSWGLTMAVCSGGGGLGSACTTLADTVTSPPVSVTPSAYSFAFTVSPATTNIGGTVSITLTNAIPPPGGFTSLTFNLGGTTCDLVTQKSVQCGSIFGGNQCQVTGSPILTYTYGASEAGKVETITATALYGSGQTLTSPSTGQVAVTTSGACPCPSVTTTVNGPNTAPVNQTVQFSASASSTAAITGYSWTFGDGGSATGQSASHTYTSSGLYTVRVTATNSCGQTGSASYSIQVGGGGDGNLTITPSPATVNPGSPVTFTFSPGVSRSGDQVTITFGDGTQAQVSYIAAFCSVASPCNMVTHPYSTPARYTVTASGTVSGVAVGGSTSVTVLSSCALPSAPAASFTFTPAAPRVGQVVGFADTSSGTPTSWAWAFGGPGVAGTSLGMVHTAATGNLAITPNPGTAAVGQTVIFTFSPALTAINDSLSFNFGDGTTTPISYNPSLCGGGCSAISHAYSAAGTYTVSASGAAGGVSVSGSSSVTVSGAGGGSLTITPSPANAAIGQTVTIAFSPAVGQTGDSVVITFGDGTSQTVSFPGCQTSGGCNVASHAYAEANTFIVTGNGTAGGAGVTGSATVVVSAGGSGGSSTAQNPSYTFTAPGTYTVTLTATNCKGSTQASQQVTVLPTCDQKAPPTPDFTWPTGAVAGFPEQQQPYVGQQITLTDASTGSPTSWHWYDFNELAMDRTVMTPTFTFTWPTNLPAGAKNLRMTAANCFGASAEVMKTMTIYPDVRHVVADFSWSDGTLATGAPVTLTAATGDAYGNPDTFTWTFDDGSTQTGPSVTHTYTCAGSHRVTLAASRSYSAAVPPGTASHTLTVTGKQCGPDAVMTVDAAKTNGLNGTTWLTDVRIFNPSSQPSQITVQLLPVGWNNSSPPSKVNTLSPHATWVLNDVLAWAQSGGVVGTDVKKAALRIVYDNPENVAPILVSETYTTAPSGGGTYGQLTPGIEVVPNTTPPILWITGVRNNGTTSGFRTNYSLLNLRDTAVSNLQFTLLDPTGKSLATQSVNLGAFEYRQDSLANLFGGASAAVSSDPLAVKVVVPADSDVQAYASVVDNLTGDPVLVPAVPPPSVPIFIPAVAYTPGVNGTVWRSDLQLTNPDAAPHTWAVTYTPGGQNPLPIVTQKPTVAAQSTVRYDDLLSWLYGNRLTDADKTSGVVEITPADGSGVYPIVQARSFNQTGNGTFGQNIPPITPDMGVAAGQGKRLLLTGMSSEDIARTNLGFVNLSATSGVNFSVMFYDQGGNVLNPVDDQQNPIPYTFSLGVGGWDQDKLENRFRNVFKTGLPANLAAISAVIQVTDGGPGTVYATVIDNLTGDPNFILAQPAP
ncbi:MAG: PKD domain-containing protein [Acidobacteria bacterium]|nr:MAG: PKD domain-containing protein [Acidobacteriota bacterium]